MRKGAQSKPMGLTIKQEKFCNYYIETGNASEAYRRAYNCDNMSEKAIWENASKLLNNTKVAPRVKELQDELKDISDITKERLMRELSNIAFSTISDMHNTWIERKDFENLSPKQKSAIKSISTKVLKKNIGTKDNPEYADVEFVKIEMHDKLKAIEDLAKMLGYNEPEKHEHIFREPMTDERAKEIMNKLSL